MFAPDYTLPYLLAAHHMCKVGLSSPERSLLQSSRAWTSTFGSLVRMNLECRSLIHDYEPGDSLELELGSLLHTSCMSMIHDLCPSQLGIELKIVSKLKIQNFAPALSR